MVDGKFELGTGLEAKPPILVDKLRPQKINVKVGEELSIVLPKNWPRQKF